MYHFKYVILGYLLILIASCSTTSEHSLSKKVKNSFISNIADKKFIAENKNNNVSFTICSDKQGDIYTIVNNFKVKSMSFKKQITSTKATYTYASIDPNQNISNSEFLITISRNKDNKIILEIKINNPSSTNMPTNSVFATEI